MSKEKKTSTKNKVASTVKSVVKNVVRKERAKVAELRIISEKAEEKVEKIKSASKQAKSKVKSKVEEIRKAVSKSAPKKQPEAKKTVESKKPVAEKKEKLAKKILASAKPAAKSVKRPSSVAAAAKPSAPEAASEFSPEYLVLMQRDPNFLHAFWDVKKERLEKALDSSDKLVLRLYDVSSDLTVRKNKNRKFRDIEIPSDAKGWYVQNRGAKSFSASLGTRTAAGEFHALVEAPAMQVFSFENVKPAAENVFFKASLGGAGIGGFGSSGLSSHSVASWLERLASSSESFFSGSLSSGALSSGSLLQPTPGSVNYGKDFFLWVKTRLIVYGGTRPDAHLQVRGEPFPLKPDGTFSFEQDLPDSTQIIPVFATDKDGDFPTTIVPIVVKRTE